MTQFSSIREGINYQRWCPICQQELGVPNVVYESQDLKAQLLQVPLQIGNIASVAVDIDSGVVKAISAWQDSEPVLPPNGFNAGDVYQGITIECLYCLSFSYTLLFKFYVNKKVEVREICLNSERIQITQGEVVHHIRNVSSLNETTYRRINLHDSTDIKQETIPLVPLNLQNPKETLARIKKLLVFS